MENFIQPAFKKNLNYMEIMPVPPLINIPSMRTFISAALLFCLSACNQQEEDDRIVLQHQIDSLHNRIDNTYAPDAPPVTNQVFEKQA